MFKNSQLEKRERFTLRKNKKYKNLVSVGLGLFIATGIAVATGNEAHASEAEQPQVIRTENPATNSIEAQPKATNEAKASIEKTGEKTGTVDVKVDSSNLDKAVNNAQAVGIKTEKEADKNLGVANSPKEAKEKEAVAKADYDKQIKDINTVTKNYEKELKEVNSEITTKLEENKSLKEKEARELAEYNKKVAEVTKHNQEVEKSNADKVKKYEELKVAVTKENEKLKSDYDKARADYEKAKADYDKSVADTNKNNSDIQKRNEAKRVAYEKAKAEYDRKLQEYETAIEKARETSSVSFEDVRFDMVASTESTQGGISHGQNSGASFMESETYKDGTFKFKHDMVFAGKRIGYGELTGKVNHLYTTNDDGTINVNINSVTLNNYKYTNIAQYRGPNENIYFRVLDPRGNEIVEYHHNGKSTFNRDISQTYNVGKSFKLASGSTSEFIPVITIHDDWEFDTHGQGFVKYTNNSRPVPIVNIPDEPTPPTPPTYEKEVGSNVEPPKEPTPPVYKDLPKEPLLDKLSVMLPKPTPPTYKEVPKLPNVPTVKYHYVDYDVNPNIYKEVKNTENQDINKHLVSKLSTVNWELKTEELPANREAVKTYVITDNLPNGFEINLDDTKKLSKGFLVEFNKGTNTVVFKADKEMIASFNKDLTKPVTPLYPTASGVVVNDGATYENNFKLEVNNYKVFSNKVVVSTPGNPDDPNHPNNNLIKPEKHNTNKEGVIIDGKTLMPNTINYYKLTWDLDQYKGIKATDKEIEKGFYYVDDFPEEAVTTNDKEVVLVDSKGQAVQGIKVETIENLETLDVKRKEALTKSGIKVKGAFQLFTVENPKDFFNKYVVTGNNITIISPMAIKEAFNGEYENKAYQIDFGNGYETDVVVNNVPKLDVKKDVVIDITSKDSLDTKTIQKGTIFNYKLIGSLLPTNRVDDIIEYSFIDNYDETGDKYSGNYKAFLTTDVKLQDGTIVSKGTDVTKYTTQVPNFEKGEVVIELDKEFLSKVSKDSEFQTEIYLQMERINSGTFKNTFENIVNGYKIISNTVETNTPEPPKPQPKPDPKPEPKKPTPPMKQLPKTSAVKNTDESNGLGAVAGAVALLGTLTLVRRRKVTDN